MRTTACLLTALLLHAAAPFAAACTVPVFRYALERWEPDDYDLLIFTKAQLDPGLQSLLQSLNPINPADGPQANLAIWTINPEQPDQTQYIPRHMLDAVNGQTLPYALLICPRRQTIVWKGPPTQRALNAIPSSPARRELARRLLQGDSAVLILLHGSNPQRNQQAALLARTVLDQAAKDISLNPLATQPAPDDTYFRRDVSGLPPLQLRFSSMEVPNQPDEALLQRMIRADLPPNTSDEPLLLWAYGRGRVLDPLTIDDPDKARQTLLHDAWFLCGDCQCQVKQLNPGIDLVYNIDWDAIIVGAYTLEQVLPGMHTSLDARQTPPGASQPTGLPQASPPTLPQPAHTPPDPLQQNAASISPVVTNLIFAFAAFALVVAILTLWFRKRTPD